MNHPPLYAYAEFGQIQKIVENIDGLLHSLSINLSCHSEEYPKGTCFAARSDVGIHNLLVANSQKSVKIVRFGNRLPRQSADWLAMTGFFDSLGLLHFCAFGDIVDMLWWTGLQRRAAALFAQQRAEATVRRGVWYTVFPSQGGLKKFFLRR